MTADIRQSADIWHDILELRIVTALEAGVSFCELMKALLLEAQGDTYILPGWVIVSVDGEEVARYRSGLQWLDGGELEWLCCYWAEPGDAHWPVPPGKRYGDSPPSPWVQGAS